MQKGMTYIVRPRIEPRKSSVMVAFISAGSVQLLVGPASSGRSEQMKVRSSTRATSLGSEVAQKEFGFDLSCTNVPASTSSWLIRAASSSDPSTHTTRSGVVSSATSRTKDSTPVCVVGAVSSPGMATAVISAPDFRRQMSPLGTAVFRSGLRCRRPNGFAHRLAKPVCVFWDSPRVAA